jgi:hypothetical protein
MVAAIPKVFKPDQYLHKAERFSIICRWFGHSQVSRFPSIRDYVLNSPKIMAAMPITEQDDFHVELDSGEIPYILFLESQVFLNRALSNFCAQIALHRAGYLSWAIITTYYSSFFALSGLVRLQGKARIATHGVPKLPRGFFLAISSLSSPRCVVFPHWRNHHEQTCSDFYYAYRNFDLFESSFGDLLSLTREDLLEAVRRRNAYNYGLETGYRELDSPDYERPDLRRMTAQMVSSLPSLVTEPDSELAYMARACSYIILLAAISWHIAKNCRVLRIVFDKFLSDRERFIDANYGRSTEMGKCFLRFTRGRMRFS